MGAENNAIGVEWNNSNLELYIDSIKIGIISIL